MLVQTRQNFDGVMTVLRTTDIIAIDTETDGLYPYEGNRLCGISTYCKVMGRDMYIGAYFPFRHADGHTLFDQSHNLPMEWLRELREVLQRTDCRFVFHNSKFDMSMLYTEDIDVQAPFYDTLVMSFLLNENGSHKLKDLAANRFGSEAKLEERKLKEYLKGSKRYDLVPPSIMEPYAVQDARLTYNLHFELIKELQAQGLMQLWPQKELFSRCLLEMERYGVLVDTELAAQLSKDAEKRMREIEDELGFDPLKLDILAHKLYAAPPEGLGLKPGPLSDTSTPEFPKGRPSMAEGILATYKHPLVDSVLEYRGLVKSNSTWFAGFAQKADKSNRMHPSFNQCPTKESETSSKEKGGTRTGRLTCSRPNMQQLPRNIEETPVRKLIICPPRWSVYEFDYSQIELRIASCYAEAELLIQAFKDGADPHQITADKLGIERTPAKHAAYTILYGGGAERLKETIERLTWQESKARIEFPAEEAQEIINGFFELHPGFRRVSRIAEQAMKKRGYVKLWNGARRRIEESWNHHKAFNSIIQGGAAQIMEQTMLRFYEKNKPYAYRMISQVHDSLWFEVVHDFREEYLQEIKEIMEWPGEKFAVPFPVDYKLISRRDIVVSETDGD